MTARPALATVLLMAGCSCVCAQRLLTPEEARRVAPLFEGSREGKLSCRSELIPPFLNFALQHEAGYTIQCQLAQFEGRPVPLQLFTRWRNADRPSMLFGEQVEMPRIPPERRAGFKWSHFHDEAEFSEGFALGEGTYQVDLVLADNRGFTHSKSWKVHVNPHGSERSVKAALSPGAVEPLAFEWQNASDDRKEVPSRQITVMVDAAPIMPWSTRLQSWDRSFLLSAVVSVLRHIPAKRVRLIVFNLDQQREVYRNEAFQPEHLTELQDSLHTLELGTVSYQNLQHPYGWSTMLNSLVSSESRSPLPSEAVIVVGPNIRFLERSPLAAAPQSPSFGSRLYYFEYFARFGSDFPDAIHRLTDAYKGTVYKMHSPAEFAASLAKLKQRLKGSGVSQDN